MDFYRQFVRDMYDQSDGSPWPLQRWTTAPSFYLGTVDATGRAIESGVIDPTIDAMRRGVSGYTAGIFRLRPLKQEPMSGPRRAIGSTSTSSEANRTTRAGSHSDHDPSSFKTLVGANAGPLVVN